MFFHFDPMYFVFLAPAFLLMIIAQFWVKRAYAVGMQIPSRLSGAAAARYILDEAGCQDVAIRPDTHTDVVFASCSGATSTGDYQILQNTTAPSTAWVQVQTQPTQGRTSLAIAPSQPSTIYAMATVNDSTSPIYHALLAVYRSTSNGDKSTWTTQVTNADSNPTNTLLLTDVRTAITTFCNTGGAVLATACTKSRSASCVPRARLSAWCSSVSTCSRT